MRYLAYTLFILICSITGCADDLDELSDHSSASKAAQTESKDVSQSSPKTLGELSYQELGEFEGEFGGYPLWVSNNPEDVLSYGLLSSTRPPRSAHPRSEVAEAPLPELIWYDEGTLASESQGCREGTYRGLNLYLAHILSSSHLRGDRRLSIIAEADESASLSFAGDLGSTSWSDLWGYKTVRSDWLGAQIAKDSLNRLGNLGLDYSPLTGETFMEAGEYQVVASVRADSLVEGGFTLESQGGCFALHVVAHQGDIDLEQGLPDYALGDVKWPGWYQGAGYGRAAGLYEGATWAGAAFYSLTGPAQAFGWRLLDAKQSPVALGHHKDSAQVLFGGYGVVYEPRITLSNDTQQCLSAQVGFTSYANFAPRPGEQSLGQQRTASVRDLEASDPSKRPTMIWNGPMQFSQQLRNGQMIDQRVEVILKPEIKAHERNQPDQVPNGLHTTFFRWDMLPGETRAALFHIPVPGYIIAPAALTVVTTPCKSSN